MAGSSRALLSIFRKLFTVGGFSRPFLRNSCPALAPDENSENSCLGMCTAFALRGNLVTLRNKVAGKLEELPKPPPRLSPRACVRRPVLAQKR